MMASFSPRISALLILLCLLAGCGVPSHSPMREEIKSYKTLRSEGMVLQTYEKTCGAAALATLMNDLSDTGYTEAQVLRSIWGDTVPLDEYRAEGRSLPATSVKQLETTARAYGFKVLALQSFEGEDSREVLRNLRPFIALLQFPTGQAHYVVVRAVHQEWLLVADPTYGTFRLPVEDFYHFWNQGGRVFVTVSKQPFYAWEDEQGNLYVNRSDTDTLPNYQNVVPTFLYTGSHKTLTFSNTLR